MSLLLPSSADLSELLHDVRLQLHTVGDHGLSVLSTAFEVNGAAPPNGRVSAATLSAVFAKVGVFMRTQQLNAFFRYLDRDSSGSVLSADVLAAVQGSLSPRRHRLLVLVFRSLDTDNSGAVPLQRVLQAFNGSQHPQVLDGSRTAAQVADHFRLSFDRCPSPLSLDLFLDRMASISAVVPLDDDFFIAFLERCFRVVEPKGDSRLSLLNRVRHLLRERTSQRETGPKTESEKLRVMLKWWDLEDSGKVTFPQFHGALQRFGLVLDDGSTRQLFDLFDAQHSGSVDYSEFVATLYEDDIVNTYWTQRQQRERQQQQTARAGAGGEAQLLRDGPRAHRSSAAHTARPARCHCRHHSAQPGPHSIHCRALRPAPRRRFRAGRSGLRQGHPVRPHCEGIRLRAPEHRRSAEGRAEPP